MNTQRWISLFASSLFVIASVNSSFAQTETDPGKAFDEVVSIVNEHFFDADVVASSQWLEAVKTCRENITVADTSTDEFVNAMNRLLQKLKASHTFYFSRNDPKRYQLLGVFNKLYDQTKTDLFVYKGIGIDTRQIRGETIVSSVFDGFPAAKSGVKFGDKIVAVNGQPFQAIRSFATQSKPSVEIQLERQGKVLQLDVDVVEIDGRTMFEDAAKASVRVIESDQYQLGYIHLWSYAGPKYQELLREQILWGKLSECDGLVLDIRDGWGGADLNYLSLFRKPIATVSSRGRDGTQGSYSGVWGKPVVLLVNGRSTSGKELLTFGFKKLTLGPVVGEKTAGAVVAGRIFLLSTGDVLYLAVRDVKVDGQRIEGKGVPPDVSVPRSLVDPPANDVQLEAALDVLTKRMEREP